MARRKKQDQETLVDIVEARRSAEEWFVDNRNIIMGVVGAIVVIVGGIFAYQELYQAPRNQEAAEQMFQAEFMFEQDSFASALNNPGGGYDGFISIIENYSGTPSANLAHYYAGVSYLNLGDFEKAAEYLEEYDAEGEVLPIMKYGTLGDTYSELGQMEEAQEAYEEAVEVKNEFLTPYYLHKLALLYMYRNENQEALEIFKRIKRDFPQSQQSRDAEKFLVRLSAEEEL